MIQLRLAECTLTGTAVHPELAEYGPGGPLPLTIAVVRGIGKRRRPDSVIAETYGIRGGHGERWPRTVVPEKAHVLLPRPEYPGHGEDSRKKSRAHRYE